MLDLNEDQLLLLNNIHNGILRPVDRLISKDQLYEILTEYQYEGETYALPYLVFVDHPVASSTINLAHNGEVVGRLINAHTYTIDVHEVARLVFGTDSIDHPGVRSLVENDGRYCLSADIDTLTCPISVPYSVTNGVRATVFQSRNPPHIAHETIIKKYAPDLTYTTPYKTAKSTDYPFSTKIKVYEKVQHVYGVDILVTTLPRVFGGPREALQNCIIFQNLGAERLVMGRGKNCVGTFYGDVESYSLCKQFYDQGKITIEPVWEHTVFVNGNEVKASVLKTEYIDNGVAPPTELMSEYISEVLLCPDD